MRRTISTGLPVLVSAFAAVLFSACSKPPPPHEVTPTVEVAHPLSRQVSDWDDYTGRFEAVDVVEVRPRVSGAVESVHFRDGQKVERGQLLFVIDPRPYAAQLARVRADLAGARAQLSNAEAELKRAQALVERQLVSQSQLDQKTAAQLQAAAALAAAEAAVQVQELNVSFTRIAAPIAGRVSYRRFAPGNIVSADATVLTTIVSEDPIRFVFDAPESALLKYRREASTAAAKTVEIKLQDEAEYRWKGRLDFIDNQLDRSSGTIRARATVANPGGFISPGMFGQMRLMAARSTDALLVPDQSIVTDQTRQVVFVVDAEGLVSQRVVEPGRLIDGLRVIRGGVTVQDRVVISGVQRARPGRKVAVTEGELTAFPTGVSRGENSKLSLPGK